MHVLSHRRRAGAALALSTITAGTSLAFAHLVSLRSATWMTAPDRWTGTDPLPALAWVAWVLAVLAATWLLLGIAVSVLAGLTRIGGAAGLTRCLTTPAIRRLAERVTAVSVAMSSVVVPATAGAQPGEPPPIPVVVVVEPGDESPAPSRGADTAPSATAVPVTVGAGGPVATVGLPRLIPTATIAPEVGSAEHVVRPGDNLWAISCAALTDRLGRSPTAAETAGFWREVIDANLPDLRSGNADLIFPGETIRLPGA